MDRKQLGERGESAAAAYLERIGIEVAERNWRSRSGEIDIIGWDDDVLVMCEVKTRRSLKAGTPEEAVTPAKQRKLARLAAEYLALVDRRPRLVRFDVVSITVLGEDRALLRHVRDAFTVA